MSSSSGALRKLGPLSKLASLSLIRMPLPLLRRRSRRATRPRSPLNRHADAADRHVQPRKEGHHRQLLASLKEARAAKTDAIRAIIAKATSENRDLSDQEQSAFDTGKVDIERLERDIANRQFIDELERRETGKPVEGGDRAFEVECREFSLVRAIASQIPGMNVDAGREKEVSRELERRAGRAAEGIMVPTAVFEKRIVTTTTPAGGPGANIIATDWRGDMFIDRLRETMVIRRLGARVLSGLTGNVDIPRLKASATAFWVAENQAITLSDPQFDKVSLTPKHCGVLTEVSRNMVQQSSPDIEDLLRSDFAQLLAAALDGAAIQGGGSNQPTGILATSGVGDVPGGAAGLGPPGPTLSGSFPTSLATTPRQAASPSSRTPRWSQRWPTP